MKGDYTYETKLFTIKPFVSGSRRHHHVQQKVKPGEHGVTGFFPDFEQARNYVLEMEEVIREQQARKVMNDFQ